MKIFRPFEPLRHARGVIDHDHDRAAVALLEQNPLHALHARGVEAR